MFIVFFRGIEKERILKSKIDSKAVIRTAGSFVAGAIGSGFATGQEIMQFFSAYGVKSIIGSAVTALIFSFCGYSFLTDGYKLAPEEGGEIIEYYIGRIPGRIFRVLILFLQFSVFVIMITGAGAIGSEIFGFHSLPGRMIMAALSFGAVILGLNRMSRITGVIGIVVIASAITAGLFGFLSSSGTISEADKIAAGADIVKTDGGWLWSGILYPALNIVAVSNLGCMLGKKSAGEKEAALSGILGGVLFGAAVCCVDLGLLANLADVYSLDIPSLAVAEKLHPLFRLFFSCMILCGIFSTAVSALWCFTSRFAKEGTAAFTAVAAAAALSAIFIGQTEFKTLINIVYPIFGYCGLFLLLGIVIKRLSK